MPVLKLYLGIEGDVGRTGIDGVGVANADGVDIEQPLLDSFYDNRLARNTVISFDRADSVSYVDRYNRNMWTKKEQTTNFITYSNDFTQWTDTDSSWSVIGATADPFGGTAATEIELDFTTSSNTNAV
jgi:hypothetical protein